MTQAQAHEPELVETPEEIAYELRAAESALWTGGRILIAIFAFFFASLAFAYFYLRSANSEELWRPHGMTAPTATGAAIMAVTVAAALLIMYGQSRLRKGVTVDWEVSGWVALAGVLLAVALQIWELTDLPFYPGASGYASCFVGWGAMNILLLLCGAYWIETLLARALRLRRAVAQDGGAAQSTLPAARTFRINVEACTYFWGFIALVGIFFWVFFYVV
ncbi:MAG: hypothetical protein ACRDZR_05775 [Acidimicrobiales bacterium]